MMPVGAEETPSSIRYGSPCVIVIDTSDQPVTLTIVSIFSQSIFVAAVRVPRDIWDIDVPHLTSIILIPPPPPGGKKNKVCPRQ